MKKFTILILAMGMFALIACSSDDSVESSSNNAIETEEMGASSDTASSMAESTEVVGDEPAETVENSIADSPESTNTTSEEAEEPKSEQSEEPVDDSDVSEPETTQPEIDNAVSPEDEAALEAILTDCNYQWGAASAYRTTLLQEAIGVTVDGVYGNGTRLAHLTALVDRGLSTDCVPTPTQQIIMNLNSEGCDDTDDSITENGISAEFKASWTNSINWIHFRTGPETQETHPDHASIDGSCAFEVAFLSTSDTASIEFSSPYTCLRLSKIQLSFFVAGGETGILNSATVSTIKDGSIVATYYTGLTVDYSVSTTPSVGTLTIPDETCDIDSIQIAVDAIIINAMGDEIHLLMDNLVFTANS